MKWIVAFASRFTADRSVAEGVTVGTRVRTQFGEGVVTSGMLAIKYKAGTKLPGANRSKNDLTQTHNLDKVEIL